MTVLSPVTTHNYVGGAIFNSYGGIVTVTDSNFTSNTANYGGAIYNDGALEC